MLIQKELFYDKIEEFKEEITAECKNIGVFGLGFVGLPLALSFAVRGCNVVGVDVVPQLVEDLRLGKTHHLESFRGFSIQEILLNKLHDQSFRPTLNAMEAMDTCNNFIITVGIPVYKGKHDMSHLETVCKTLASGLKRGDTVIVRGTVIPGTTINFIKPLLEESGYKAGRDFYLAYASERIAEGKAFDEFENMPSLVAGINELSAVRAKQILGIVTKADIHIASSIEVVETAKVIENIQRDVNIAMVQEFSSFCESVGIDIFEVIELANTHKRVNLLYPGPGVGGYCLPNAFYYLKPKADELGVNLELLAKARKTNDSIPQLLIQKMKKRLSEKGQGLKGATVAILGLAMKDYSNDDRISPAVEIANLLVDHGAVVKAYDPKVPTEYSFKVGSLEECLQNADGVMILAKQKGLEAAVNFITPNMVVMDLRRMLVSNKK